LKEHDYFLEIGNRGRPNFLFSAELSKLRVPDNESAVRVSQRVKIPPAVSNVSDRFRSLLAVSNHVVFEVH
jgi:hypothetical protein